MGHGCLEETITLSPQQQGGRVMPFTGIANQHDIETMTDVLAVYCRERGIADEEGRTAIAERIASMFFSGRATADEILDALRTSDRESHPGIGNAA
jgi:hypothetical protein